MPTTKTTTKSTPEVEEEENCDTLMASLQSTKTTGEETQPQLQPQPPTTKIMPASTPTPTLLPLLASAAACNKQLLFCRRFKDASIDGAGLLRNFNSLPLFVYATSPSTHASSADGVGVAREAAAAAATAFTQKNEGFEFPGTHGTCRTDGSCISQHKNSTNSNNNNNHNNSNNSNSNNHNSGGLPRVTELSSGAMECLPMSGGVVTHHPHLMATSGAGSAVVASPTATVVVGATYPHHLHHHHHHLSHHAPYSNSYGSHPHHPIHSEQTKSLQELQHEVGALLEFRDLVIETFPDLKHKMASMSTTPSTPNSVGILGGSHSVGGIGGGSSSLAARREWEPGIRMKRKLSHKEPSTTTTATVASAAGAEPSSSSLTRSRSNSHSGKKEPKSGENNNGSVVQDSGFSTETSSSKEGHSASSTNGAMTVAIASNRLSCAESDDELLNLLDVIHRKSNRLREEVEQLQSYERQQGDVGIKGQKNASGMTPQQFREQVDRLNREDIKQLRKERDRLLDKLAEMEAETLTGRIKAAKMNDQVEELISVKKDLEEQLKLAMAQKLELSSRVQQLQLQQQQQQQQQQLQLHQSKSSSSTSQSDFSSQRNFSSSATTVLSNSSRPSLNSTNNTFQPVVLEQPQSQSQLQSQQEAFHQSSGSDNNATLARRQQQQQLTLGRLDGVVSTPGARNTKCRITDSKRFSAILLETNVLELQRHLLTLTVQNQVLAQKLDSSGKSKTLLAKRLDKSQEDSEELRFQLEEKNIELEGTKAQLRVLESRLHTSSSTNSYFNSSSQHDYETNRSSASTTLMLSRRGVPDSVDSQSAIVTAAATTTMPRSDQISTPSMKAMVPLAMDELQQHSSSTESAHEHEPERTPNETQSKTIVNMSPSPLGSSTPTVPPNGSSIAARVMSSSVVGVSSYDQTPARNYAFRKFNSASKPSKIPLPGSKAAAYFAGKPPTGRPSIAGRSPPSVHNSSSVSYGSKSSLSRSTGNLNQSLKRADSASNHSLSTNTSRSSTSSSIPLATTPYSSSNRSSHTTTTTPSPRVLQNSPLPKLKRETLSSRVRHLDSLSRAQQSPEQQQQQLQLQQQLNNSNSNSNSSASHKSSPSSGSSSSIAAQLSTTLRKDLQLSASSASSYHRRGTVAGGNGVTGVARRFSSASVAGARLAREQMSNDPTATPTSSYGDSDSGKNLSNSICKPNFRFNNNNWQLWQTTNNNKNNVYKKNSNNMTILEEQSYFNELLNEAGNLSEETAYDSYYTQYTTPDSMDCGSDNLLVTFDYGYSDSIGAPAATMPAVAYAEDDATDGGAIWFGTPPNDDNTFKVHHVQHKQTLPEESLHSLISYDVDDIEELSEPESHSEQEQEEKSEPNLDYNEVFYDSIEC